MTRRRPATALLLAAWLALAWPPAWSAQVGQAPLGAATQPPPRWIDAAGRPAAPALQALAILARAGDEGLDPAAYGAAVLAADADALAQAAPAAARAWDARLSAAMQRYLRHLHVGRVQPVGMGWRIAARDTEHDYAAALDDALRAGRLEDAVRAMAPPLAQYAALREQLHRYRALAAGAQPQPLAMPRRPVRAGDASDEAARLRARLVQLGDLPAGATAAVSSSGAVDLVDALKRFQARHGLAADGVPGPATVAALNVPVAQRVRQIELALERLRWLPHPDGRRVVAINIPMFRLWGWDPATAAGPAAGPDMGVIVGRALRTPTPVMVEEMRQVVFRPYWNVPRSILRNEVLPKVARDPSYLQRHGMEIVRGEGDDARPVAPSAQAIGLLRDGALRVRQRPGPANSLGLVKFMFPNSDNVYMHGTPATELFARTRRDFSHGCVRLEDPVAMAEWVLAGQAPWTRERIVEAMHGAHPQVVTLQRPVRVVLFYTTAAVPSRDGTLHFADDIYGHDARLERALQALAAPAAL